MRAAWYEKQGPPSESLVVGDMPEPTPGPGEIRMRIAVSGVNPGDVKKRQDTFGVGMAYPRVIPHSDGAGIVDGVGNGVDSRWIGRRVWCFGAQSYRPFGTAAELCVIPEAQVFELPVVPLRTSFGIAKHPAFVVTRPIVITYNDGSLLTLDTDTLNPENSFYCTNFPPTVFAVEFAGTIDGGEGRFEGATGAWTGTAQSVSSRVTGELEINLN